MPLTSFDVQPNPLTVGGTATVSVGGAEPNSPVTINIDNGGEPPETASVTIQTDANGNGSNTWTVKSWDLAKFNTAGAEEIQRTIVHNPHG